jgi:DNA modification methylase
MGGKEAKLCFTSPPYNMGNKSLYADYDDDLPSRDYIEFNLSIVRNVQEHLKGFLFWNMSYNKNSRWEWIEVFHRIIKETGFRFLECIVWDKGHGLPVLSKDAFTRQYENILVAENQDEPKDIDFVFIGANQRVAFHKGHKKKLTNYWYFSTQNTQIEGHGACFPVELPKRAIELMTDRGDIVLDPFGGSGSTLIAAEQCGRVAYLVEKSPLFCDVIRKRYEQYTKQS